MTYSILFATCPTDKSADEISEVLLKKKLAACVKLSSVQSRYWWEGKIEKHPEVLMTVLTKTNLYEQIEKLIKKMHPYNVPEIISFKIDNGNRTYLNWVSSVTK